MVGLFGQDLERRIEDLDLPSEDWQATMDQREELAALEIPASLGEPLRTQLRSAVHEAFLSGFRGVMWTAAALALLASLSAGWLIREGSAPKDQRWFRHPDMQARMAQAESDLAEGRFTRTETLEEAQALLDELKQKHKERR
jgi:hypothetical protein